MANRTPAGTANDTSLNEGKNSLSCEVATLLEYFPIKDLMFRKLLGDIHKNKLEKPFG